LVPVLFLVATLAIILLPEIAYAVRAQWLPSEQARMEYLPYVLNVEASQIRAIWSYFMQLTNIILILLVVIVAFSEMLHLQIDTYGLKKILPTFLLGVLAANLSFIFCRLIIDVGNATNLLFLHEMNNKVWGSDLDFLSAFNPSFKQGADTGTKAWIFVMGIMDFLFGVAVAILKLYISFVLLARDWVILALIAVSPAAFIALAFPPTKQYFSKWWSMFIKWVFMPVAINAILWFASVIASIFSNGLVNFFIYLGALYLASRVPSQMGGEIMQRWTGMLKAPSRWIAGWGQRMGDRNPLSGIANVTSHVLSPDRLIKATQNKINTPINQGEKAMDNSPIGVAARGREAQEKYYTQQAETETAGYSDQQAAETHQKEFYGDTEGKNFGDPGYGHDGAMFKLATNTRSSTNNKVVEKMATDAGYYTEKKDKQGKTVNDKKTGKPVMVADSEKMREKIRRMDPEAVAAAKKWMNSSSAIEVADGLGTSIKDAARIKVNTQNFMRKKGSIDTASKKQKAQDKPQPDNSSTQKPTPKETQGTADGQPSKEEFGNNGQGPDGAGAPPESELDRRRRQGIPDFDVLTPEQVAEWQRQHQTQGETPQPDTTNTAPAGGAEPTTQGAEEDKSSGSTSKDKEKTPGVTIQADQVDLQTDKFNTRKPEMPPVPPTSDTTGELEGEGLDQIIVTPPTGTVAEGEIPPVIPATVVGSASVPASDLENMDIISGERGGSSKPDLPIDQAETPSRSEPAKMTEPKEPKTESPASVVINTNLTDINTDAVDMARKPAETQAPEITATVEVPSAEADVKIGETPFESPTASELPTPLVTPDMSKIEMATGAAQGTENERPVQEDEPGEPRADTQSPASVIINTDQADIHFGEVTAKTTPSLPEQASVNEQEEGAVVAGAQIPAEADAFAQSETSPVVEAEGALPNQAETAGVSGEAILAEEVPEEITQPIESGLNQAAKELAQEEEPVQETQGEEPEEEQAGKGEEESDTDKLLHALETINASIATSAKINQETLLKQVAPDIVNSVKAHQTTSKDIATSLKDPRLQKKIGIIYARALKRLNQTRPDSVIVSNIKGATAQPQPINPKTLPENQPGTTGPDQIGKAVPVTQQPAGQQSSGSNTPVINKTEISVKPEMTGQPRSSVGPVPISKSPISNNRNIPPSAPNGL